MSDGKMNALITFVVMLLVVGVPLTLNYLLK